MPSGCYTATTTKLCRGSEKAHTTHIGYTISSEALPIRKSLASFITAYKLLGETNSYICAVEVV